MSRTIKIELVPEEIEGKTGFRWKIIRASAGLSMDLGGERDPVREIGCIDATITVYGESSRNEETLQSLKKLLLSQGVAYYSKEMRPFDIIPHFLDLNRNELAVWSDR